MTKYYDIPETKILCEVTYQFICPSCDEFLTVKRQLRMNYLRSTILIYCEKCHNFIHIKEEK